MITRFGTAKVMILQEVIENEQELLLAIDQRGLYLTQSKYLDKNISDPNRVSSRKPMEERMKALNIDYKKVFEENKHLIPTLPKEVVAKVNPLKASKRSMKK